MADVGGGGGITFKQIVQNDNAYAKQLKQSNEGGNVEEIQRNQSTDHVTTEGFSEAEVGAGKDKNDVNVVMAAFDKGDHKFTEDEFNQMQAMLDHPEQLHQAEQMIKDIYKANKIPSADGNNDPDGAGMGAWTKRAFALMQANPHLTPAQLKASLETEIKAAHENPGNAAPQPRAGAPAGSPY